VDSPDFDPGTTPKAIMIRLEGEEVILKEEVVDYGRTKTLLKRFCAAHSKACSISESGNVFVSSLRINERDFTVRAIASVKVFGFSQAPLSLSSFLFI